MAMSIATQRADQSATERQSWAMVDTGSPMPLYHQVYNSILHAIRTGLVHPGEAIPTEAELCAAFGVSRITIRQALGDLVSAGHLHRERPRGPLLVKSAPIEQRLGRLTAFFFTDAFSQGHEPRFVVREVAREAAGGQGVHLQVPADEEVIRIERTLVDREEPLALLTSYIPLRTCAAILDADLSGSLVPILEQHCGIRLHDASQWIVARLATEEERRSLGMEAPDAVVVIRRLTRGEDGTPVEYLRCVFRADRYEFVMEVTQ
jgi:GntR family transcriptional regulator